MKKETDSDKEVSFIVSRRRSRGEQAIFAPEFLIDGQNSRLIRRRQTLDELLETEIV